MIPGVTDAIQAAAGDAAPLVVKGIEKVPGRVLLVDGDYLVYYTCGNDETSIGDARMRLMQKLQDLKTMAGAETVVMHLTASGSHKGWRYIISKVQPYQKQREGSKKPKNWALLRDFVESYNGAAFRQKIWGTREADDGICYHAKVLPYGKAVVAMKDKDSQMFTGCLHLDWDTFELTEVPEGTFEIENSVGRLFGHKWFWLQLLMGDSADHIPGLPRLRSHTGTMVLCGKSRALDALCMINDNAEAFKTVAQHYMVFYKEAWADQLVEQMALLWMRQDKDAEIDDFLRVIPTDSPASMAVTVAAASLVNRVKEEIDATANL